MTYFAELDENDKVIQVIVAEQFFINSLPNKEKFVETKQHDKNFRRNYASIGYIYDRIRDVFIEKQHYPSWILDKDGFWKSPTDIPVYDKQLHILKWNENNKEWSLEINRNV